MITSIINYLIRSGLSLVLLYLFFSLVLSRERMHRFNRLYLFVSLLFSLVVPLLTYPVMSVSSSAGKIIDIAGIQNSYYQIGTLGPDTLNGTDPYWLILIVYILVTLVLIIRFFANITRLMLKRSNCSSVLVDGHRIVMINEPVLPYSFFSTVFVNKKEYNEGKIPMELLTHEFTHIVQHHSLDIVFVELLKVFFWFNPIIAYYKKAIILNHEYLADEAVARSESNVITYTNILLNTAFRNNETYLASSFNYSFTKKRLQMMTKKSFSKRAILRKIAVIPFFFVTGFLAIDAQEPARKVETYLPPPPPPPPPPQNTAEDMWWNPILRENNITPDPAKSMFTQTFYETGDEFSFEDDIVKMKGAFILAKSVDNIFRIIRAKSATHDFKSNFIRGQGAKVETFRQANNSSTLINTEYYKDFSFRLSNGIIAPPPPPPPPPPAK